MGVNNLVRKLNNTHNTHRVYNTGCSQHIRLAYNLLAHQSSYTLGPTHRREAPFLLDGLCSHPQR